MNSHQIIDVTLRDGAYLFHHDFPLTTIQNIATCLDEAGLPYIEIGHGSGVGAREKGFFPEGSSDLAIAECARLCVKRAKLGMLASSQFTTVEQLKNLRPFLDFIRIGANVDRTRESGILIEAASKLGYEVFLQLMRSPRVTPARAAESARFAESLGVKVVYLVDSAGGWSPWQVPDYVQEILATVSIPVGIHAHNHLGMALANTLAALGAGCRWADASLRGIGRGAGNAQLELLAIHLHRLGHEIGIDEEILQIASGILTEELSPEPRGISAEDYLPASVGIDIYPLSLFIKICQAAGVDLRTLVSALGHVPGMVEMQPADLATAIASLGLDPAIVFKRVGIPFPS